MPDAHPRPPCDICGESSSITDGIVRAYLCESPQCLDEAWDKAFGGQA